ncbi:MAG: zinc-dependent metalloprotease, partial [Kineosporiaceae bacterium]
AAVWAALTQARGAAGRDELWRHPDLVPTAEAFADPAGFARAESPAAQGDAMDAALAALLDEEARGDDDGEG